MPAEMPVLCQLGLHRPSPWPRWNAGYYFSRCERCHADLVRTAYGGWQVPHGFRVLWQAEPPSGALLQARPVPAPPTPETAEQDVAEAEVREVAVAQSPAADAKDRNREPPGDPAPMATTAARPRSSIPDFMEETPAAAPQAPSAHSDPEPTPEPAVVPELQTAAPARPFFDRFKNHVLKASSRVRAVSSATEGQRHALAYPAIGFFLVTVVAAVVLSLIEWPTVRSQPSAVAAQQEEQAVPRVEGLQPVAAMVEASLLNCRSQPVEQSPVLQRLGRGENVLLLDRTGGWAGVDTGRNRCWVLERHLSIGDPSWLTSA